MEIQYKSEVEFQEVDINKLRPNKSYDYLIENRNASLNKILNNKDELQRFIDYRNCPVCNQNNYDFLYKKDSLDLVKCKNCSVIYVNPIFNEEKYYEIYRSEEYQRIVKRLGEDSHFYRKERFGRERMDIIEKFHDPKLPKRILDIGCSTGFVIEEAQERKWDAIGVELNPSAADFAKQRGMKVITKPLQEIEFDEQFSVVTLYDVLEHLVNPGEILRIIYEILLPGGNIYIYVPNYNSASKELLGIESAHFIWPTHHLTYFTPETLKFFLKRYSFDVFSWETQGLDLYDWHWYLREKTNYDTALLRKHLELFQFYVNAAGHGKNLRMYAKRIK